MVKFMLLTFQVFSPAWATVSTGNGWELQTVLGKEKKISFDMEAFPFKRFYISISDSGRKGFKSLRM